MLEMIRVNCIMIMLLGKSWRAPRISSDIDIASNPKQQTSVFPLDLTVHFPTCWFDLCKC
jgi:hypothetical protein